MCWDLIPGELLLEIYRNLPDGDLVRASRTCKHWRRVYHDPSLWRVRTFDLGKMNARNLKETILGIRSLVQHVQQVEILFPVKGARKSSQKLNFVNQLLSSMVRQGDDLALQSLLIDNIHFHDRYYERDLELSSLSQTICSLLEMQSQLKVLSFKQAYFDRPIDVMILFELANSKSTKSLEVLDVSHYCGHPHENWNVGRPLAAVFGACVQLRELRMNFSYIWALPEVPIPESLKQSLELFVIYSHCPRQANVDMHYSQGACAAYWKMMCCFFPKLKVKFHCHYLPEVPAILFSPCMPLVEVTVQEDRIPHNSRNVGNLSSAFLNHLAQYFQTSLQVVTLLPQSGTTCLVKKEAVVKVGAKCEVLKEMNFNSVLMTEKLKEEAKAEVLWKWNQSKLVINIR